MNLDYLIGAECLGGFIAGFRHGMTHDRNIVAPLDIKEQYIDDKVKFGKLIQQSHKILRKTEYFESSIVAVATGIANLALTFNMDAYTDGFFLSGVSFYSGLKTGRMYSNFTRSRKKVTPEQESIIDGYIENLRSCYKNDDDQFENLTEKLREYTSEITQKALNPKVDKLLIDKVRPPLKPMKEYRDMKRFLSMTSDDSVGFMDFGKEGRPTDVMFLHDDKLYRVNAKDMDANDEQEFVQMIDRMEQLPFNGSIDEIFNHIQDFGNYRNTILVNAPKDAALDQLLLTARSYYKMKRWKND